MPDKGVKHGSKRLVFSDIARLAGVSRPAVSYVLSNNNQGPRRVSEKTAARIRQIAEQLNFRPNSLARALRTGRTHLITLWTYLPYRPFFAMVAAAAQRNAWTRGFGLLAADVTLGEKAGVRAVLSPWPSDGILAMDCGPWADWISQMRPSNDTPIVSMGTSPIPETDYVRIDFGGAFRDAARHLIEQGCRRIAYFRWPNGHDVPYLAYAEAMREAGLAEEAILIESDRAHRQDAQAAMMEYVRANGCPDGIVCRNDDLSIGAYRGLCDLGRRVGQDVLLTGCDGIEDAEYVDCPLTTIALPVDEMCDAAMKYMDCRLADPGGPLETTTFPAELRVRASSKRSAPSAGAGEKSASVSLEIH